MAISYPISLPSAPGFASVSLRPVAMVAVSVSPFTGQQQVHAHQGQLWQIDVETVLMDRAAAEPWRAALLSLNGREGSFRLGDPSAATPRGVATGTPLVNGAGQSTGTLATDGWTASVTNILRAGDYIQIGDYLHRNLTDVNSNGSGQATLEIWPRAKSYADNAPITVTSTKGIWRLLANEMAEEIIPPALYRFRFSAITAQ